MELRFSLVRGVREKRSLAKIPPKQEVSLVVSVRDERTARVLNEGADFVRALAGVGDLKIGIGLPKPGAASTVVHAEYTAHVPMPLESILAERERMRRRLEQTEADLARKRAQLANPRFREAKPDMAAQIEEQAAAAETAVRELRRNLEEMEGEEEA